MTTCQRTAFGHLASITILFFVCWSTSARTQSASAIDARMVILNVRVTDSESHAVIDAKRDDFAVMEDGAPQKITFFSKEQIPVSYGLVIDNSGSLRSQLGKVVQSGIRIVDSNKPGDEAFLVRFISRDRSKRFRNSPPTRGSCKINWTACMLKVAKLRYLMPSFCQQKN